MNILSLNSIDAVFLIAS